jgi:hypothetical protein
MISSVVALIPKKRMPNSIAIQGSSPVTPRDRTSSLRSR